MAALTWQQVANPNFSGGNDMFRTGAQLQQGALSGLGDAIAKFRAEQTANLDSAVLNRALRVNNSGDYQKALTDGSFLAGVNPNQVSPKTLAALGARSTELIGQDSTRSGTAARDYTSNRAQFEDYLSDAARGQTAQRLGNSGAIANLSPQEQVAMRQAEVGIQGGMLNNENRAFGNRTQLRDDDANQVGLTAGVNLLRQSGDRTDALANLESMNDLQPQEMDSARRYLEGTFGSLYGDPAAASGSGRAGSAGGKGGKPGTAAGSPYDTTFNFQGTSTPISSMPISQVLDEQEKSKSTQGHSPMGAFQINKATLEGLAPKVLGKDWKDQPFTPEVQERLAEELFNQRKGGDLTKTWAALPNSSPGAYKNMSWAEMRNVLSQGEVGQNLPDDPASLRLMSQASQFEANRRAAQNDSVGVVADVAKNMGDSRSAPELVQEAVKTQFPNADQGDLLGMVNKIQRDNPGLSAADALSAVSRSARNSSWWRPGTTTFGDGVGVDDSALEANVKSIKEGKADYMSQANQLTRAQASKVESAQTKFDEAYQNLLQRQARQQVQPGLDTERAQAAFEKASAQLKRALADQQQNPNYRPVRQ